jgi:urease accessory protein
MYGVISPSEAEAASAPGAGAGKRGSARSAILQRTFGVIELVFSLGGEATTATRVYQQGALRARFPNGAAGQPPEAVLLNLAGGLTGGDRLDIAVRLHEGAEAVVSTQSCERIYRSSGNDAVVAGNIRLAQGSRLEWLPQPVILFDGARLKRETHVELSADSHLLALESVIFGRTESGETVRSGALLDGWFVHRGGELIQAECLALSGEIGATLAKAAVLNGNRAIATLRYVAPDAEGRLDHMRAILAAPEATPAVITASSAWNGMLVTRFVAPDGYALTCEIARVLGAFRGKPLPRVWSL